MYAHSLENVLGILPCIWHKLSFLFEVTFQTYQLRINIFQQIKISNWLLFSDSNKTLFWEYLGNYSEEKLGYRIFPEVIMTFVCELKKNVSVSDISWK